jgi:hypothetical protein
MARLNVGNWTVRMGGEWRCSSSRSYPTAGFYISGVELTYSAIIALVTGIIL